MKLSVIIANHNYRDYVGAAIESALAVDWPDKEVIVVDDASTDDSRGVIDSFQGKVAAYYRPKSNQLGAHMFGFEQSTGDIIIFLDADDLLEPEVMQEVAKVWRPGVSKVQYRMNLIDATGTQLGSAIPQFPPQDDPEKLRRTFLRTMAYITPPGSGNAYSRDFVRNVFAFGPTIPQSDAVLLTIAPILGDVLTIRKPLARLRIHGASWGSMIGSLDPFKLRQMLHQDVERAQLFSKVSRQLRLPASRDPSEEQLSPFAISARLLLIRAVHPPFFGRHHVGRALSFNLFGGQVFADASARQSDTDRLGDRMCAGAAALSSKPNPMALFRNFATRSVEDIAQQTEFAPIRPPCRPSLNTDHQQRSVCALNEIISHQ